jgi:hypothetical protein
MAELFPEAPVGQYIVVDGTDVPAWCPQRSAKRNGVLDRKLEARYRKRVPEADFRSIKYDRDGQFDPAQEQARRGRANAKSWRGYSFVLGCDAVTGLPMVGSLHGAANHEPHAGRALMERLYDFWPESPLEVVVADRLWDDDPSSQFFEAHYGVHLIAHRRPSHIEKGGKEFSVGRPGYRGGVAAVGGDGIAHCREHGKPLLFEGTDAPSRVDLAPGEFAARSFRSRFRCHEGHRLSLPTNLAWSALPYYPLHPLGRPDLHAMRIALLSRRNVVESAFSSMKGAFRQGNSGQSRTRIFDREVHESLIWISLLTRALLALADAREERLTSVRAA